MSDNENQYFIKTSARRERERQRKLDDLEKLVNLTEDERKKQKTYIYDKLFRFLSIDLTIFPIITALFFIYFETANDILIIFSFLSFFIAVLYKFGITLKKLESYLTPTDAYDNIKEEERAFQLILHRMEKTKALDEYNTKLIDYINHSICFTMGSIVISLINVFQLYMLKILPSLIGIIPIILFLFSLGVFILSVFYKGIFGNKIKLFLKKLVDFIKYRIIRLFKESIAIVIQLGNKPIQALTYWWIGTIYNKMSKKNDALSYLERALNIYHELGLDNGAKKIQSMINEIKSKK